MVMYSCRRLAASLLASDSAISTSGLILITALLGCARVALRCERHSCGAAAGARSPSCSTPRPSFGLRRDEQRHAALTGVLHHFFDLRLGHVARVDAGDAVPLLVDREHDVRRFG